MAKSKKQHRTVGGRLYEILAREIISGKMRPGQRLVEDDIGKRFKASRTPVREVLNKLGKDDLVELVPHRGGYVKGLTAKDIEHVPSHPSPPLSGTGPTTCRPSCLTCSSGTVAGARQIAKTQRGRQG